MNTRIDEVIDRCEGVKPHLMDNQDVGRLLNKIVDELVLVKKEVQMQSTWIDCLWSSGVDNWEGYEYAIERMDEQYPDGWDF